LKPSGLTLDTSLSCRFPRWMNEATSLTSSYDNPGSRKLARTRIRAVRSRCSRRARERRCGESQLPLCLVLSVQSGGLNRRHSKWISTHPTTAAAHQDPAATDPKLQFQTAWLQYCHGTPGLQEVLAECVAGECVAGVFFSIVDE
jgi:hypothetical protein